MVKIGIAPDSWGIWFAGKPNQVPWYRFLDEVVEAGFADSPGASREGFDDFFDFGVGGLRGLAG